LKQQVLSLKGDGVEGWMEDIAHWRCVEDVASGLSDCVLFRAGCLARSSPLLSHIEDSRNYPHLLRKWPGKELLGVQTTVIEVAGLHRWPFWWQEEEPRVKYDV
jgi:hypothetical protein